MILLDTSVWADHFRRHVPEVALLFAQGEVVHHPFVTGELAMGNPADRKSMTAFLLTLPDATIVDEADFLEFVEREALFGTGLGFVDAHLLASAHAGSHQLWSTDKRLAHQADRLGLSYIAS